MYEAWKVLNKPVFRITTLRREMIDCYSIVAASIAIGFVAGLIIR